MDSAYFKEYYHLERTHWWFRARQIILESQVQLICKSKVLNILNVGVATGSSSMMLSKYGKVTSVEFDPDCCRFLKEELKFEVTEASVTDLPFDSNSFDLICAFDVIEHVENDRLAIQELTRVCKQEGIIFTTVPAYQFLWSKHDEINHHVRRYTANRFCNLFGNNGQFVFKSYFNSLLFIPVAALRLASAIIPIDKLKSGSGSDFTMPGQNKAGQLLFRIFKSENTLLKRRIKIPVGISFLSIWKKQN